MALNYQKIKVFTEAIESNQKALTNIRTLGVKLAASKNDLNVCIKIKTLVKDGKMNPDTMGGNQAIVIIPGGDVFGKGNAGPGFDIRVIEGTEGQPINNSLYREEGFESENMPNEVALVMLNTMVNWYKGKLQVAKFELDAYLISELSSISKVIEQG